MPTGAQIAYTASTQAGDRYVFGAEASPTDPNPRAFDCSELVEWACGRVGVRPRMVDGAENQYNFCRTHGTLTSIGHAINTRGALLFKIKSVGVDHVAISRGGGQTIEAKGRKWGVGIFSAMNRGWNHAALIPGVSYETGPPSMAPPPRPPAPQVVTKPMMALTALAHVKQLPDLHPGNVNLHVIWLQRALNIASGAGVKDDGHYGAATVAAVWAFQRFLNITADPFGHAQNHTRFMLAAALKAIAEGRA